MTKFFKNLYWRINNRMCSSEMCRPMAAMLLTLFVASVANAAGNGLSGINEATTMVTSYFEPGVKLIYAIGAVVGLIGGVKVCSTARSGSFVSSVTAFNVCLIS